MNNEVIIRQATIDDINFVIEAIIEADKSSTDMISLCNVFAFDADEYKKILFDILNQNIENYDYFLSGYVIAETNGEYVGACGSWLEGADGVQSGIIKSTMLFPYIKDEKIDEIKNNLQIIKEFTLNREIGALQIENIYVREKFRGCGIFYLLVTENIKRNKKKYSFTKVQPILLKSNYKSYSAFLKFGYKIVCEKRTHNPEILKFFPYDTRILMELDQESITKL
ncbi:MAG: hypothetical protein M1480_11345 [Bacteroidetes bacterium]|nr:hypothetical protein [Bacteroidota bacterium]